MIAVDISNEELSNKVLNFLKTPEGREVVKQQGANLGYTDEELTALAVELRAMITDAFIGIQRQAHPHFDDSAVKIQVIRNAQKPRLGADKYIRITYTSKTLHRYSLVAHDQSNKSGSLYEGSELYHTGGGIDDIFALVTQGYSTHKRVFGFWADLDGWERDDYGGVTASLTHREPNAFLSETIQKFQTMHPDVEVQYPDEWKVGGNG